MFDSHCATHQIRVILISCVVITSLLYPALAIYSPSIPLSTVSSTLLSLLPTDSQSPHLSDLHDVWNGHEALHVRYDATAKARCGLERTVRVERLLIASHRRHENGVLNKPALGLTLDLEAEINARLASATQYLPCVHTQAAKCLYTSPLSFWNHDPAVLNADEDIIGTLNKLTNTTDNGFAVTLPMVVADRAGLENEEVVDIGTFLVLTYYFRDDDCHSQGGHIAWVDLVQAAIQGKGLAQVVAGQPRLLALQFDADHSRISPITILLYTIYLVVFINFSGSLRRMNTVHSRFGIAFTGIVEIIVSTITSISVCAIWGFRVTMVPWGLLPIVIVFVGAENMFRLVDEVVSTSITLPVKERIALGLSEAGASNTLKVVTCNAALGIIAVFAPGAIRQFCVFALVVLVAHWFLVHTFFVAVLSIDLQRLEAHRKPRMDGKDLKSGPSSPLDTKHPKEAPGLMHRLLYGSAARNGSLILMLVITAVLYQVTSSAVPGTRSTYTRDKVVALRKAGSQSPSWKLWLTLNPDDDPLLHLRTEPPVVVFFDRQQSSDDSKPFQERKTGTKMVRATKNAVKIFILPIATTTALLWALLIYLLKDTEGREAPESGHQRKESQTVLENGFQFSTIPRACAADVEYVDATPDGSTVIAVSVENEVALWSEKAGSYLNLTVSDIDDHGSFVTAVAMDSCGIFCAAGTKDGAIAIWRLENGRIADRRLLRRSSNASRVVKLAFEDRPAQRGDRPSMLHRRSLSGDTHITEGYLLATYKDGSAVEWNDLHNPSPVMVIESGEENSRILIMRPTIGDSLQLAKLSADGSVQLYTRDIHEWQAQEVCHITGSNDPVTKIHTAMINIDLSPRIILIAATKSGQVSLWDVSSGSRWLLFDEIFEDVMRLRLSRVPTMACITCGELRPDAFIASVATWTTVIMYRFSIEDARRCSCPILQANPLPSALRSRQGSFTTLSSSSRLKHAGPTPSASSLTGASEFPVSAHGVHSRRGSERDQPRRIEGSFYLLDDGANPRDESLPDLQCSRIAEVSFQDGAWDTLDHMVYGFRRSSDLETLEEDPDAEEGAAEDVAIASSGRWTSHYEGLEKPVLERWKLWVFDPTTPDLSIRESTLAALAANPAKHHEPPQTTSTLHNRAEKSPVAVSKRPSNPLQNYRTPSAYPRLPFTEVSSLISLGHHACLVAFGNTIGLVTFSAADSSSSCFTRTLRSRTSSVLTAVPPVPKKRI
ncbi:SubName: Full=Related to Sterol regulatory element binding protein cleavage-activating protein {ECO:0000313/EMBL:CCA66870.1} [Serendipita indica DSM 11827]|nr:SubName: Full=Related to Sterol regulatory element binding protein cleavage-activating protein {ECO:0000313/EMBL:CCA66870.1} [Serendipita indica DSM 11827]